MIRDILYLIVYFITETVLYSLAYRTVLSRGITNKAVRWMIYIIAVVITGSIVYVNNNLQYVMGASIFIMVMLPVFIIEPFEIQNLILYPFVVIASSIFGILFSFIISIKIRICITKISTFLILCDLAVCLATLYVSFSLVFALMRYLQGKVFLIRFYSPTTLSSSRAEFRLPSRLACA